MSNYVLLVDDDEDILDITGSLLEAEGYRVRRATDLEQTFERIKSDMPQVVLVDLVFPANKFAIFL